MEIQVTAKSLRPGADFNPACFDFTEIEAREMNLWRDPRPMPVVGSEEWNTAALMVAKSGKRQIIKSEFIIDVMNGTYYSPALDFEVDNRRDGVNNDLQNIKDLVEAQIASVVFYGTNDISMTLTRQQLIALGYEMRDDLLAKQQRKIDRKEEIRSATTVSEVDSILW